MDVLQSIQCETCHFSPCRHQNYSSDPIEKSKIQPTKWFMTIHHGLMLKSELNAFFCHSQMKNFLTNKNNSIISRDRHSSGFIFNNSYVIAKSTRSKLLRNCSFHHVLVSNILILSKLIR